MEDKIIIIKCPHCNEDIIIFEKEINCKIFRHGVYKNNFQQINPHLHKDGCDELFEKKLIFGCGKPFQLKHIDNKWDVYKCEYI